MKYFGTDGIRGKFGELITSQFAMDLGKALKTLRSSTIVIATDTRESKDAISLALIAGAKSVGVSIIEAGVLPTPGLINFCQKVGNVGVMITASHNPYYDNGIKIFNRGYKLTEEEEQKIEDAIDGKITFPDVNDGISLYTNVEESYFEFLYQHRFKSNLKVAIDCANGATCEAAPYIFDEITNNLCITAYTPNGRNINDGVGSTHIDHILNFTKERQCDVGFAFDGDGDRVIAVEDGKVIDGDQIIYIIAKYFKNAGILNNNTVVLTKMSNLGILNSLTALDINYVLTDVGDKHVVKELLGNDYSIGGENSGHIIMPDFLTSGDGILVAMTLLRIMTESNKTLAQLLEGVEMYHDKMLNLVVRDKNIIKQDFVIKKIKEIEDVLKGDGKVIVRASGTEDLIRVSVMAKDETLVDKYLKELNEMIGD